MSLTDTGGTWGGVVTAAGLAAQPSLNQNKHLLLIMSDRLQVGRVVPHVRARQHRAGRGLVGASGWARAVSLLSLVVERLLAGETVDCVPAVRQRRPGLLRWRCRAPTAGAGKASEASSQN